MGATAQAVEKAKGTASAMRPELPDRETASRDLDNSVDFWEGQFDQLDQMNIMKTVQMIGSAVVAIAIIAVVVNQVLTTSAVANTTGPFDPVIDQLGTTGVAAMGLLIVGLIVAAASQLMGFMRGGF